MIKKNFSTPFHCFPTIPILSLPWGPGDVLIVSDQNIVCWYIGLHSLVDRRTHELQQLFNNASCVYLWLLEVSHFMDDVHGLSQLVVFPGWELQLSMLRSRSCPKTEELPGKFILYVHEEHTITEDHKENLA